LGAVLSFDDGRTFDTNWIMEFTRVPTEFTRMPLD